MSLIGLMIGRMGSMGPKIFVSYRFASLWALS